MLPLLHLRNLDETDRRIVRVAIQSGAKAVKYFLMPDLIREVKVEAARSDRDQSEVVAAALMAYLDIPAKPGRRARPEAATA
jgi:hypothetical protein